MLYNHIILTAAFIGLASAHPLLPSFDVNADSPKLIQVVEANVAARMVANAGADCEGKRVAARRAIEKAQNLQLVTVRRMQMNGINRLSYSPKDYDVGALELPNLLVNPNHDDGEPHNGQYGQRTLLELKVDLWAANRAILRVQNDAMKAQEALQQCLASANGASSTTVLI